MKTVPSQAPLEIREFDQRSDDRDPAWSSAMSADSPLFAFESEEPTVESEPLEGAPVADDPCEEFNSEITISHVRSHASPTPPLRNEVPLGQVAHRAQPDPHMSTARRSRSRAMGALAAACVLGIGAFVVSPHGRDTDAVAILPATVSPRRTVAQNVEPAAAVSVPTPPGGVRRVALFEAATDTAPAEIVSRPRAEFPLHLDARALVVPVLAPASVEPVTVEPAVPPAPLARTEPDPPAVVGVDRPSPLSPSPIDQDRVRDEEGIQRVLQRYQLAYDERCRHDGLPDGYRPSVRTSGPTYACTDQASAAVPSEAVVVGRRQGGE